MRLRKGSHSYFVLIKLISLMKNTTQFNFLTKGRSPGYKSGVSASVLWRTLLPMLFLLCYFGAKAQFYNVNRSCTTTFNDISATGTVPTEGANRTYDIPMPFDFAYFGVGYSTPDMRASLHGFILFDKLAGRLTRMNTALPVTDPDLVPEGALMPHWDFQGRDASDAAIFYQVSGAAPYRVFTIQWSNVRKALSTTPLVLSTGTISFQVLFFETTNEIRFVYGDTIYGSEVSDGSEGNNGASATIGLQNGDTPATYYSESYNSPTLLERTKCISFVPSSTDAGCTLSCFSSNIGLDAECHATLVANSLVAQGGNCSLQKKIVLRTAMNGQILESGTDTLFADGFILNTNVPYVLKDKTYVIEISEIGNSPNNTCWNTHLFQDKIAPQFDCPSVAEIPCYTLPIFPNIGGIVDCAGDVQMVELENNTEYFDCNDRRSSAYIGQVYRTFYLVDGSGNISDTCTQTINLLLPDTADINGLPTVNLYCNDIFAQDSEGHPAPSVTGVPTIGSDSIALYPSSLELVCNMATSYSDRVIFAGCLTKIMRTWTISHWRCSGEQELTILQTIMINDTLPPVITSLPDVTISTNSGLCTATYSVPAISVYDICNHTGTVDVKYPGGHKVQNGGFNITLPIGENEIIYIVADGCGNIIRDTMIVTVNDNEAPVAICKDAIVSLTNLGSGRMYAGAINNGSHDNGCGPVSVKIRRMNADCNRDGDPQNVEFRDYIDFYCCDVDNNPILVLMEVTDASGLKNTCMASVTVQNKNKPDVRFTLPNLTIVCTFPFDRDNLAASFGTYVSTESGRNSYSINRINFKDGLIIGVCALTITELPTEYHLSNCGYGYFIRKFQYTDGANSAILTQRIDVVSDGDELVRDDFYRPQDTVINNGVCNIDDIKDFDFGGLYRPRLKGSISSCHNLMMNFRDDVYQNVPGICYKIVRNWTIIDWCLSESHDNDYMLAHKITFAQVIMVSNSIAPEFVPHADINETTDNCAGKQFIISTTATDECGVVFYSYKIDFNFNDIIPTWDFTGNGRIINVNLPLGVHKVRFYATDGCGNVSEQTFLVTLTNNKKPTVILHNLVTELMANHTITLNAQLFNVASVAGCPGNAPVTFSFSPNVADNLRTFDCDDPIDSSFQVAIYVTDKSGNQDFAYALLQLQDNMFPCPDGLIPTISGLIYTDSDLGIPDVKVETKDGMSNTTDVHGEYALRYVEKNKMYDIEPFEDALPLNGVSTGDIIKIQNHILGRNLLTSPYRQISADVSEDGKITGLDIVMIRQLVLGKIDQFASGKSWKFIDKNYQFINPSNAIAENYPQSIQTSTDSRRNNVDFVGVKLGDVDGTVTVGLNDGGISIRNTGYNFVVDNTKLTRGQSFEITMDRSEGNLMGGLQIALQLNPALIIESISADGFVMNAENYRLTDDNQLLISVLRDEQASSVGNQAITITVLATNDMNVADAIHIAYGSLVNEGYDINGNAEGVQLSFRDAAPVHILNVEQNRPNPFADQTIINYTTTESGKVTLKVYDLNGRLILEKERNSNAGLHQFEISSNELSATGVLIYEISNATEAVVRRMVRIK